MKVGLIGATNVGKSSLFNRLVWSHRAIVTDIAGTTRDIITETYDLNGHTIQIADSPGLDTFSDELIYIRSIIQDSDYLLFVVDYHTGLWPKEQEIVWLIRKYGKQDQTLLVINKVDKWMRETDKEIMSSEYWSLWLGSMVMISAKNGANLDELEEILYGIVTTHSFKRIDSKHELIVTFMGKPNVGKSTLLNTFTRSSVSNVSDQPGTTLDYISETLSYGDTIFKMIDTAWIRKSNKPFGLEKIANSKTLTMLSYNKPIVVLIRDAVDWVTKQDLHLVSELIGLWLPIIIARNKIDQLTPIELERIKKWTPELMQFARWIPICYISAQQGKHLDNLVKVIKKVHANRSVRLSTHTLNTAVLNAQVQSPAKFPKNKICKIRYITQIEWEQPTFVCFVNSMEKMNFSLARWLDNVLRRSFDFAGVPIKIDFRWSKDKKEQ